LATDSGADAGTEGGLIGPFGISGSSIPIICVVACASAPYPPRGW
jgi:hypothetical protein